MCVNPIKIKNRTLHFTKENNPYILFVPCGRCYECRQQIQNDWFVRSFLEWRSNEDGINFFYTLTYNNANVPKFGSVLCFSRRDIQLFLKRLRKSLSFFGIKLKYIITCEYGEKNGRPHYHIIFYLSNQINPYQFYKLVQKHWTYGFVKYGENVGLIKDYRGIRYVTKYVSKDMSFMRKSGKSVLCAVYYRYNTLFNYICRRYGLKLDFSLYYDVENYKFSVRDFHGKSVKETHPFYDLAHSLLVKCRRIASAVIPFHLQSTNLGSKMIESEYVDIDNEQVFIPIGSDNIRSYPLPRYFKRKLWCDCLENENDGKCNKFVLNERGKQHLLSRLDSQIEKRLLAIQKTIFSADRCTDGDWFNVNSMADVHFDSKHDLVYFMKNIDLDLNVMAIYDVVFRGRVNYMNNCLFTNDLVRDNYIKITEYHLNAVCDYDMGRIYETNCFDDVRKLESLTFNFHPFFQPYETTLKILEAFSLSQKKAEIEAKEAAEKLQRETRELLLFKDCPY